jgi:translation initiation factor 2B subunit (eIF-2B alpha/beta/delta family)
MPLTDELERRVAALSEDHLSGATALLDRAIDILGAAATAGLTTEAATALCRAQPAMASMWNAALAALCAQTEPGALQQFRERRQRAGAALTRFAVPALLPSPPRKLHLLTLSASGAVLTVVRALCGEIDVEISCGEGRPLLEGRLQAAALADAGARVQLLTDVGLGSRIEQADAVLVGADAVGPHAFINKAGTRLLAAAAQHRGVAVYVLASRDKLSMPALWPHLAIHPESPREVWDEPPPGVRVENRYFEQVPLDLATAVITDIGVLGVDMVPSACAAIETPQRRRALAELLQSL